MIKLGILGMSPGNAHPYSWSAIVNGSYDGSEITRVGYPNVAKYLEQNKSDIGIQHARVTHIWTQDMAISKSISQFASIENIVTRYPDMIGEVDAVIIARDDPERHRKMAQPFIEADVPLFVDKPLAANMEDLHYFKKLVEEGKFIMSCSSMRYAVETKQALHDLDQLGKIELAVAVGQKDWIKYGVHMLEAVFTMLGDPKPISVWSVGEEDKAIVRIAFSNGILVTVHLFMDISSTFQIDLYGSEDFATYEIKDSYYMFRANLDAFIRGVRKGQSLLSFDKTYNIIKTIISGIDSQNEGKKILF